MTEEIDSEETAESTVGPDSSSGTVRTNWDDAIPPSVAVVEAIATARDQGVLDLTPLQEYVDSDALDAFVTASDRDRRPERRISFGYEDLDVIVEGDGAITVSPADTKGK